MSVLKFRNPNYTEGGSEEKWITLPTGGGGIEEAPEDGNQYVRQDGQWAEVDVPESSITFTDMSASNWVSDSTYEAYPYRCDLACSGVTANDYAEVVYGMNEATSGLYAPICSTSTDIVSIWSSQNTTITIPTIKIIR